ncbi:MAG: hypothetical protein EXQ90_07650 [Rhodospirillales bacterium]|nr:hypothetical protein [Rhodospirillales bacterium]
MAALDITPLVQSGRLIIQAYGGGQFRIAGQVHVGSVLVRSEGTISWPVSAPDAVTLGSVDAWLAGVEILLVGCGPKFLPPPQDLRAALKARGVALEWMDTGAACRTFNVLLAEERRAIAGLISVP